MFSGAGLLIAKACHICPSMPSLVLCRCILNYTLCWRITALFIKWGDNFFWIALQSGRVLTASQDCFQQFMHAAYAKCSRHIYKAAGEIWMNACLSKSKLHFSVHALCIYLLRWSRRYPNLKKMQKKNTNIPRSRMHFSTRRRPFIRKRQSQIRVFIKNVQTLGIFPLRGRLVYNCLCLHYL